MYRILHMIFNHFGQKILVTRKLGSLIMEGWSCHEGILRKHCLRFVHSILKLQTATYKTNISFLKNYRTFHKILMQTMSMFREPIDCFNEKKFAIYIQENIIIQSLLTQNTTHFFKIHDSWANSRKLFFLFIN